MAALSYIIAALVIPNGFGLNIHFTGNPDLDMLADAGFKFIRMDLAWGAIEKEKGKYNFSAYDALAEGCQERGIRIIYILDYSNTLYESENSVRTDEGREAYARFAEAAASRYMGKGILWEIWNEPNLEKFWSPQPSFDDYSMMAITAAYRIKKTDPKALVIAPAVSGIPLEWLEETFKKNLLSFIDAVSVHPYRTKSPETVMADYAKLRELIKKYAPKGKDIPIISGEWGYSEINWDRSELSEEQQGQYLVRMFLINMFEEVPVSIWYDWKDDGTDPNEREHHFGTVTYDLKPKPAYLAAKVLTANLSGYRILKRIETGNDADFAFKLTNGKDEAVAFWTTGEEHEIALSISAGKGLLVGMLGARKDLVWDNGKLEVAISQSPQYLLLK